MKVNVDVQGVMYIFNLVIKQNMDLLMKKYSNSQYNKINN